MFCRFRRVINGWETMRADRMGPRSKRGATGVLLAGMACGKVVPQRRIADGSQMRRVYLLVTHPGATPKSDGFGKKNSLKNAHVWETSHLCRSSGAMCGKQVSYGPMIDGQGVMGRPGEAEARFRRPGQARFILRVECGGDVKEPDRPLGLSRREAGMRRPVVGGTRQP